MNKLIDVKLVVEIDLVGFKITMKKGSFESGYVFTWSVVEHIHYLGNVIRQHITRMNQEILYHA
jgi:hypothetical protein